MTTIVKVYDYATWYADTKKAGGVPVAWPFSSGIYGQYYGKPAAKFSALSYVNAANAGAIVNTTPTQTDRTSSVVYVLAPQSAWAGAPKTNTAAGSFWNWAFTRGDQAADAVGLPSLKDIKGFIKSLGKDALLIGGVIAVGWYLLKRGGRHE
jgi:hypothetical protein